MKNLNTAQMLLAAMGVTAIHTEAGSFRNRSFTKSGPGSMPHRISKKVQLILEKKERCKASPEFTLTGAFNRVQCEPSPQRQII